MPEHLVAHYDHHAHALDSARRKGFAEQGWLDRLLLAVPKGGHILDLGCGGGEPIDRYLIDSGRQLTGVDLSEKMIALVRTRFPRHVWLRADMRSAAMARLFDGVLAWDSLFHLNPDEQAAMIAKAARWLAPGGAILFNTSPARDAAIDERLLHPALAPAEFRTMLAELGLLEVAFAPEDEATHGRSVWLVRKG